MNSNTINQEVAGMSVKCRFHVEARQHGRKRILAGEKTDKPSPSGVTPRISKLMALAIHFEGLLQRGEVRDYAELARLGHVTRARITQIMNLLNLAPDIQEELMFLPEIKIGREKISEKKIREITMTLLWREQRNKLQCLMKYE